MIPTLVGIKGRKPTFEMKEPCLPGGKGRQAKHQFREGKPIK